MIGMVGHLAGGRVISRVLGRRVVLGGRARVVRDVNDGHVLPVLTPVSRVIQLHRFQSVFQVFLVHVGTIHVVLHVVVV